MRVVPNRRVAMRVCSWDGGVCLGIVVAIVLQCVARSSATWAGSLSRPKPLLFRAHCPYWHCQFSTGCCFSFLAMACISGSFQDLACYGCSWQSSGHLTSVPSTTWHRTANVSKSPSAAVPFLDSQISSSSDSRSMTHLCTLGPQ